MVGGDVTADVVGIISTSTGVLYVGRGVLLSGTGFVEMDQAGYLWKYRRVSSIIREPEFIAEFPELDTDDKLKKVSAPFPADFPEADLLKHKHYDVMSVKPEALVQSDDLLQKVDAVFRKMYKFNCFNYTIDNQ